MPADTPERRLDFDDPTTAAAFHAQLEPLRAELRLHCYRFVGSLHDAEDLVQESFLRAWKSRHTFKGHAALRTWLYKIATNVCLDHLARRDAGSGGTLASAVDAAAGEVGNVDPLPDTWLVGSSGPEARYSLRESVALAFLAALRVLTARQRAVLLLRDVMGWEIDDIAELLGLAVSAVNSVLHRARVAIEQRGADDGAAAATPPAQDPAVLGLLRRYLRAWESADVGALASLLRDDVTFNMPPDPGVLHGLSAVVQNLERVFSAMPRGTVRLRSAGVNGQPAFALFRRGEADNALPYALHVLTVRDGLVAAITTFKRPELFARFGLPESVDLREDLQPGD